MNAEARRKSRIYRVFDFSRRPDWLLAGLLFIVHLGLVLPWLYVHGAGEPDSNHMLTDIYQAVLQKTWFHGNLYMLMGQPLYYAVGFAVQTAGHFSYDTLAFIMSAFAALWGAGASALVFMVGRRFADRSAALLGSLLCMSSATLLESSTYTHPVLLSILLMLAGCYSVLRGLDGQSKGKSWNARRIGWMFAAVLLGSAAVGARADVALLFHLYIILPLLAVTETREKKWWRTAIAGTAVVMAAVLLGLCIIAPFSGSADAGGAAEKLIKLVRGFFDLMPVVDGLLELGFGFGIVGSLLFLVMLVIALAWRKWVVVLLALLLILPPLVFAMGNAQPARRWLPAIFAMALAVIALWQTAPRGRWKQAGPSLGLAAIFINIILLPLAGVWMRRSGVPVTHHTLLYRSVVSVVKHHRVNQQFLYRIDKQMQEVREGAQPVLIVGGFANVAFLKAAFCRDHAKVITEIMAAGPGYFMTKVIGEGRIYYVAECLPNSNPPVPHIRPAKIYQMRENMPQKWNELGPVVKLIPAPDKSLRMWVPAPQK